MFACWTLRRARHEAVEAEAQRLRRELGDQAYHHARSQAIAAIRREDRAEERRWNAIRMRIAKLDGTWGQVKPKWRDD